MGNVTGVTRLYGTPNALTISFEYDPVYNRPASVTDPLTHKTTITYDDVARTVTVKDPLNHSTVITLIEQGQGLSVQDPLTHSTTFAYRLGDLWSQTDALGRAFTQFADGGGRIASLTDPLGRTTTADYDNLNGPLHITDPLGNQTRFWTNLEVNYQEALARERAHAELKREASWARKFPLKELRLYGRLRPNATDTEAVDAILRFFGVSSRTAWENRWLHPTVSFRASSSF